MRMGMRRFTRLTNAFSKKLENHAAAVTIHFAYYNFARPHASLSLASPHGPKIKQTPRWPQASRTGFGAWKTSWRWPTSSVY